MGEQLTASSRITRHVAVHHGRYVDSVRLLRVSRDLLGREGIMTASLVMATPLNLRLLAEDGFTGIAASPNDLVVALAGHDISELQDVAGSVEHLLTESSPVQSSVSPVRARTIAGGLRHDPDANLVIIAVPGPYAALEAWDALRAGRDVFLFSDNVPRDDEIALKRYAQSRDLLVMGPDCGTAMIDGIGIGFANRVRTGNIGLVGASGTGLQQVSCLVHDLGGGISHMYGTGSHDLAAEVAGLSTLTAIDRLMADPATERIGLVSKPSDPDAAHATLERLAASGKPAVACLLRSDLAHDRVTMAADLSEMADLLMGLPRHKVLGSVQGQSIKRLAGIFAGGTLCEEARLVAARAGVDVSGFVDLGDDEYTQGRAHPMIDSRFRSGEIARSGEWADVLLFDVVLGGLADLDPATELAAAVEEARVRANRQGRSFSAFATLVGTDLDPQGIERQRLTLEAAGVEVSSRNVVAARRAVEATSDGATRDRP